MSSYGTGSKGILGIGIGLFLFLLLPWQPGIAAGKARPLGPPLAGLESLKAWAEPSGLKIGTAVSLEGFRNDPIYHRVLQSEFNLLTPENIMKWEFIHPERERFDFAEPDGLVRYAGILGFKVRGHALVWHRQLPTWVLDPSLSPEELRTILQTHIQTVVAHYRDFYPGVVPYWDVLNEILDDQAQPRSSVWLRAFQNIADLAEASLRWAHEADPQALLFYNDYNIEDLGPKATAAYHLVRELKRRRAPLHGVGFQMHLNSLRIVSPNLAELPLAMKRYGDLGLDVHVTELDYMIMRNLGDTERQAQEDGYRRTLQACLYISACKVFSIWGVTDKYSWIPTQAYGPLFGSAHPLDSQYRVKPPYFALLDEFKRSPLARRRRSP